MAAEGHGVGHDLAGHGPASMGPRPDGRGRLTKMGSGCARAASVNGAAAGWPRKAGERLADFIFWAERQWGRGRMAAEGVLLHDVLVRRGEASMGPRPDGRGKSLILGAQLDDAHLRQWGRGRMAAEGG